MAEILNNVTIYSPKSLSELISTKAKNPDAVFFSGGTYLMAREGFYPNAGTRSLIRINTVPEMNRIVHADRYLEAGAGVTIQSLINSGGYILSRNLLQSLEKIASSVIRNQATVGGALCTERCVSALPCYLATVGAQVELKLINKKGKKRVRILSPSRWMPVSKLYDETGHFLYCKDAVVTRIRIPAQGASNQIFRTLGSPLKDAQTCVIFGFNYTVNQASVVEPDVCIEFPGRGFFQSAEVNSAIAAMSLPFRLDKIKKVSKILLQELSAKCPEANEIQLERISRLFETVLYDANSEFFEG